MEISNKVKVCNEDKNKNVVKEALTINEFKSNKYNTNMMDIQMSFYSYLVFKFTFYGKQKIHKESYFTYNTMVSLKYGFKLMMEKIEKGECFTELDGVLTTCVGNEISIKTAMGNSILMYPELAQADDVNINLGIAMECADWGVVHFITLEDFETLNYFIQEFNLQLTSQITATNYNILRNEAMES